MSEPKPADPQEWAEAFLTISAACIGFTLLGGAWPVGLLALPISLVAASVIRSLPNPPASQGETP